MTADLSPYDEKLGSILSAAASIFSAKGYHHASIRDIARATGVSLSGLYYYFQSKEELLYLIQDHALGTLLERLDEALENVDDPETRLRTLIEKHITYFVDNMAEMKVLSHESNSLSGEKLHRVNAKKRRLVEIASDTLDALRPSTATDSRVATFALFGMMNWMYTWYRPERDVPVERLVNEITHLYLMGFLTDSATAGSFGQDGSGLGFTSDNVHG